MPPPINHIRSSASAEIVRWKALADEALAAKQVLVQRTRELEAQRNEVRAPPLFLQTRCITLRIEQTSNPPKHSLTPGPAPP